jgi:DNA-binding NtrC family response regulator
MDIGDGPGLPSFDAVSMTKDRSHVTALLDEVPSFSRQNRGGIFLVIKGPDRGESARLTDQPVTFGSSPSSSVVLTDKTVSRTHLRAELDGDEVIMVDNGSTNGSFIHGSRFEKISIGFGAEIKLGRTVIKFLPDEEIVDPEPSEQAAFGSIVGADTKMRRMFALLERYAQGDGTVLISGETGTGKELVAEAIHGASARRRGPFVVVDCGALPAQLTESELFGHVRGAFTGAEHDRRGAFEQAHGGTIFLDEIGELPLPLQPLLLRALEARTVRPVGGSGERAVDVRVIAASHRDLRVEVNRKRFRSDLYFRLAVLPVEVPPLRDRTGDLEVLIAHFWPLFRPGQAPPPDVVTALARLDWPGNVRELRNAVERACLLAEQGRLNLDDALVADNSASPSLGIRTDLPFKEAKGQLVEMFEREYIEDLMRRHKMNLSAAAREAQIDRKHLRELIRKYGLDPRVKLDDDDGDLE